MVKYNFGTPDSVLRLGHFSSVKETLFKLKINILVEWSFIKDVVKPKTLLPLFFSNSLLHLHTKPPCAINLWISLNSIFRWLKMTEPTGLKFVPSWGCILFHQAHSLDPRSSYFWAALANQFWASPSKMFRLGTGGWKGKLEGLFPNLLDRFYYCVWKVINNFVPYSTVF